MSRSPQGTVTIDNQQFGQSERGFVGRKLGEAKFVSGVIGKIILRDF
jgi:hypothetical protein